MFFVALVMLDPVHIEMDSQFSELLIGTSQMQYSSFEAMSHGAAILSLVLSGHLLRGVQERNTEPVR